MKELKGSLSSIDFSTCPSSSRLREMLDNVEAQVGKSVEYVAKGNAVGFCAGVPEEQSEVDVLLAHLRLCIVRYSVPRGSRGPAERVKQVWMTRRCLSSKTGCFRTASSRC